MGFAQTKAALVNAFKLPNTPVIALHGLWGSGKTHLWRELEGELVRDEIVTPLYVSCMAYGSIAALKSAVITMLLSRTPGLAKHGEKIFRIGIAIANWKLPKELQFSASLSDVQAFLPALKNVLSGKTLLVLDDIERATELDIRELLGFVSFLIDQLGIRVLLILNKEKLGERHAAWAQLREKIVSIEIALKTEPSDCVAIGLGDMPSSHFSVFADRIQRLGVTNIRALQHMRRVYDALSAAQRLDDDQWSQLIPSVVLFVVLHFNILDDAPTVDQALTPYALLSKDTKELTEEQKKAQKIIADYKLGSPDDFEEKVLVPYLRSGYLDAQAFAGYVKEIYNRRRRHDAENAVSDFFIRYNWDPAVSTEGLLALVEMLRPRLDVIDARHATRLAEITVQLGSASLADAIIADWLNVNADWFKSGSMDENFFLFAHDLGEIHPDIRAAYEARYGELYPPLSLRESIDYIYHNSSWGSRHSDPLEKATQDEFESLIRTAEPEFRRRLFLFFEKHLSGRVLGGFSQSTARFAEACRAIVTQEPDSRLATLIRRFFDARALTHILVSPSAT